MDFSLLLSNITNPTLLFFVLGVLAVKVKSDLEIPASSAKFISLYLLFAIGFKGGQELSHSDFSSEILWSLVFGLLVSAVIPAYSFFVLRLKLPVSDSAAIAAAYGSVSAVTFVAASSFLESRQLTFGGHMVAVMAMMEAPAIIVGMLLLRSFESDSSVTFRQTAHHSFTNGSVLLILGSLIIGLIADEKQAEGIKPFTTDIFKGFLAIFLLEMGMVSGRNLSSFFRFGWFAPLFAIFVPLVNGCSIAWLSGIISDDPGNRLMFAILAASASYIAVPAAMKIAAPKADPGLYIPMALAITFPLNITLGLPLYMWVIQN
jgi:hypothetical protein